MFTLLRYFIITILLLFNNKVSSQVNIDHSYHFAAGATVGMFFANTSKKPLLSSLLASAALGVGKEIVDKKSGKHFDLSDVTATVLGGMTSAIIVKLLKRKHEIHRLARTML